MNLLLDFGNTRLKWGLANRAGAGQPSTLIKRGAVSYETADLAAWIASLPHASLMQARYASVVAPEREQAVLSLLPPTLVSERIHVTPVAGTLQNAYASQATLGVDRWLAAMGAWAQVQQACLVVSAGTATTVDLIESASNGQGVYRGGLILPGIELMHQALHQGTAQLPGSPGRYRVAPEVADNTQDAITSGIFEATCGAIERMGARLPAGAPWLLTGGNAAALAEALNGRAQPVDDLVLAGLVQI